MKELLSVLPFKYEYDIWTRFGDYTKRRLTYDLQYPQCLSSELDAGDGNLYNRTAE